MGWTELESRQNPAVKAAVALGDKKGRDAAGLFVAEGFTLLFDFIRAGLYPRSVFLSSEKRNRCAEVDRALGAHPCTCYLTSPHVFEKLTTEKGSEGIVSLFSSRELSESVPVGKNGKYVALENVQDPGNLGTVLRTAAALGFDAVFSVGGADPLGIKAVRASMGALARIAVKRFSTTEDLFSYLDAEKISSVAACLHPEAIPVEEADLSAPVCILIGNEGKGLSEAAVLRSGQKAIIPITGMESLNAAVAAAIFLWETVRRERL